MSKWRNFALPVALILPIVLLAAQWAQARSDAAEGVIWFIPVTGYDPHDMLRGHYVMLRYKWQGIADDAYPAGLCIQGTAPTIESVAELRYEEDGDPLTDGCSAFVLSNGNSAGPDPVRVTRLYTDRKMAQTIEKQLANGREGTLAARIRPDGVIVPIRFDAKKWSPPPPAPPA